MRPDRPTGGLGIDPGHVKCGLAVLAPDGTVLEHRVVPAARLVEALDGSLQRFELLWVVIGDGTRSAEVAAAVERAMPAVRLEIRDEQGTTLLGRARYWAENPPQGLWRLIPTTLRLPPQPFDDWVAVILAERFLRECNFLKSDGPN